VSLAAEMAAAVDATLTLGHITASVEMFRPGAPHVDPAWKGTIVGFAAKDLAPKAGVIVDSGTVPQRLNRAAVRTKADVLVVGHGLLRGHLGDNGNVYGIIRESSGTCCNTDCPPPRRRYPRSKNSLRGLSTAMPERIVRSRVALRRQNPL
jgi:hypothetical protein